MTTVVVLLVVVCLGVDDVVLVVDSVCVQKSSSLSHLHSSLSHLHVRKLSDEVDKRPRREQFNSQRDP